MKSRLMRARESVGTGWVTLPGFKVPPVVETEPATIEISGKVVCYFQDDVLLGRLLHAARCRQERLLLRLVRPHMPKRMFLRLRGRMRAARR